MGVTNQHAIHFRPEMADELPLPREGGARDTFPGLGYDLESTPDSEKDHSSNVCLDEHTDSSDKDACLSSHQYAEPEMSSDLAERLGVESPMSIQQRRPRVPARGLYRNGMKIYERMNTDRFLSAERRTRDRKRRDVDTKKLAMMMARTPIITYHDSGEFIGDLGIVDYEEISTTKGRADLESPNYGYVVETLALEDMSR